VIGHLRIGERRNLEKLDFHPNLISIDMIIVSEMPEKPSRI
jgi:hypothetical protein